MFLGIDNTEIDRKCDICLLLNNTILNMSSFLCNNEIEPGIIHFLQALILNTERRSSGNL